MNGKEKCNLLKQIRKEIAESNGIVYLTSECTHEGNCKGSCPKCDAEIRYLDAELNRKVAKGEAISVAGLSLETYNSVNENSRFSSVPDDLITPEVSMLTGQDISEVVEGNLQMFPDEEEVTEMGSLPAFYQGNSDECYEITIEELDFSVRTYNCLRRAGILTVGQLIKMTKQDLCKIRNFGSNSMDEIKEKLARIGLKLYDEGE